MPGGTPGTALELTGSAGDTEYVALAEPAAASNVVRLPVHDTRTERLSRSASMIMEGIPIDDIVETLVKETPVAEDKPINWHEVRESAYKICYDWVNSRAKEEPRIADTLPDNLKKDWYDTLQRGGTPCLKKRRYWYVKDLGAATPIPDAKEPAAGVKKTTHEEEKEKNEKKSKYPTLNFNRVYDFAAISPRGMVLGQAVSAGHSQRHDGPRRSGQVLPGFSRSGVDGNGEDPTAPLSAAATACLVSQF
jgi:hypothetical protein